VRRHITLLQNAPNTCRQKVGFACAWTCYHEHRSIYIVHRFALLRVEFVRDALKSVVVIFASHIFFIWIKTADKDRKKECIFFVFFGAETSVLAKYKKNALNTALPRSVEVFLRLVKVFLHSVESLTHLNGILLRLVESLMRSVEVLMCLVEVLLRSVEPLMPLDDILTRLIGILPHFLPCFSGYLY
jgi:hypothetical protein